MKKRKGSVITTVKGKKRRHGVKGYKRRRPNKDGVPFWIKIKKRWWKYQWKKKQKEIKEETNENL